MPTLRVLEWPHKILETDAEEVKVFDADLGQFVRDMYETMAGAGGIGLAANQVGVLKRVIAIYIPWAQNRYAEQEEQREWWHDKRLTLINPKIVKREGKIRWQEGCLSFPEIFDFVDRAAEVWVEAKDETGHPVQFHATGLLAVCVQHEVDHIDGVVFFNRMSRLKANLIKKKMLRRASARTLEHQASQEA